MIFNKDIKMADVILSNHHLLSVFTRFGINLGFGDKTIEEVCNENRVNADFFLEIVNAFNEPEYHPENHLQMFPLSLIITYLKNTHSYYLNRKIPEIQALITTLLEENKDKRIKELTLINNFFREYHQHLKLHIEREEKVVYPYILKLEQYTNNPQSLADDEINELRSYAIGRYVEEHDDIEESLLDLKTLMIKYLPPLKNNILCYKILGQLGHLEKDINDHSNLENRILIPRVQFMETKLN
ncbi:MAG: hemerythrin domain-containing protein [Bacteroidales bacterium]|nr:hemerythrin domain-containing protein [Bacteroidales bacterium]